MIFDLQQQEPDTFAEFDVCIVGAGAAGITLACHLARAGRSVYLLEAGGSTLEPDAQDSYKGTASHLPHRGLHGGRFRIMGGTTTQWGGQILELDDVDFDKRAWVDGSGWPFAKSTLRPFYRRAAQFEGIGNAITPDEQVWQYLGLAAPVFPGLDSYLSRWCPEPNFSYLHAATLRSNAIHLWLHASATKLSLEDDAAVGVTASTQTGKSASFRARQYVFCLGAIESSRFFLQPDLCHRANQSNLLGRHFQDHIDCNVGSLQPNSLSGLHTAFDSIFLRGFKYQPKIRMPAAEQADAQILNVSGSLQFDSDTTETMAEVRTTVKQLMRGRFRDVHAGDILKIVSHCPSVLQQAYRYIFKHRSYQSSRSTISLRAHCEQEATSQSTITLSHERDSLGLHRTCLAWRISSLELRTIRHFANMAKSSLRSFGEVHLNPSLEDDSELTARCEDSFHHMGGMRMHDNPSLGVVDTSLKLHGLHNTYVCSSAVFPTSGSSNPTHTLLALTVRLADHLLK